MRRHLGTVCLVLLLSVVHSPPSSAQQIIGKVMSASDRAPVSFALISVRREGEEPLGLCITTNRMRSRGGTGDCAMVEVYLDDVRMADPAIELQGMEPANISHFELIPAIEAGAKYGTG